MARTGRSFPAKAIIGKPLASTYTGTGALAMSLTLAGTGTIVPPTPGARPRLVLQAVNRAGNYHHLPRRPECPIWQHPLRMLPSMPLPHSLDF